LVDTLEPDTNVHIYLESIGDTPPLSFEEEAALTIRIRGGDRGARDRLVTANLRFVVSVAAKFRGRGVPFADLICAGNVGLIKATENFDETLGFKFISYAVWWIRQAIQQTIYEYTRIVHQPWNRITMMGKVTRFKAEFRQLRERSPTDRELAEEFECEESKIRGLLVSSQFEKSLDSPINEEGRSLSDILEDGSQESPDAGVIQMSLIERMAEVVATLDERESDVINLYFGLSGEGKTLQEIGEKFGLTRERVRQIKMKALKKMRFRLKEKEVDLV